MIQAMCYEVGDVTVVKINGRIAADQNRPFRDICEKQLKDKKVIFCMEDLNFTGSANISTFFESIHLINEACVVGLKSDFFKILELKGLDRIKTYSSLTEAKIGMNVSMIE